MKFNFNPQILEKHVEKIVLAVAVLGAGWIAWSGFEPISLPTDKTITASNVEEHVTAAVNRLEQVRKQTAEIPPARLAPRLQNYLAEYRKITVENPLSQELVAAVIPRFAPLQQPIVNVKGPGAQQETQIATVTVPTPTQVTAVTDRGAVLPPNTPTSTYSQEDSIDQPPQPQGGTSTYSPGMPYMPPGAAPAAPVGPQPVDKTWVCVSGLFPMADFVNQLNNPTIPENQKLPPDARRAVIVRIEVQRHTRDGLAWTPWEDVTPAKVGGPLIPPIQWKALSDLDVVTTVSSLDASFQRIVEPLFYVRATPTGTQAILPPILVPPAATRPGAATPPGRTPMANTNRPGMPPNLPPGVPAPGGYGRPPYPYRPNPNMQPTNPDQIDQMDQEDMSATPPAPGIPDPNQLKQQPQIPFWFYDTSVEGGKDYQYRVRVAMYNPVYRYPGGLKDPKMKDQPLIYSDWVTIAQPVSVSADLYFFVNSPVGNGPIQTADFRVYKWTSGNWYTAEWREQIGEEVNGPMRLIDKGPPVPQLNVDTGYRLVDIQTSPSGGEINAVLLTADGKQLVTHNSRADSVNNQLRNDLQAKAVKPKPRVPTTRPNPLLMRNNPNNPNNPDNIDNIDTPP